VILARLTGAIRNTAGKSDPLTATPGFNAGAMVDRVLSDLGRDSGRLVLVIDDVHELAPTVQTHLTRLVAELPAQVHADARAALSAHKPPEVGDRASSISR
jgi:ATP/maltotriose-dependent transcriptional regulator MalT